MPSIANPPSPKLTTLEDAFNAWLVAQHPKEPGLTNAERSNEDQGVTPLPRTVAGL